MEETTMKSFARDMAVIGLAIGDDFTIWYKVNLNTTS
jgi:hypothetical protein